LIRCTGRDLGIEPFRAARAGGNTNCLGDKGLQRPDSADIFVFCQICRIAFATPFFLNDVEILMVIISFF
jgi:hypothetical protein